jgi:hypothetical protein
MTFTPPGAPSPLRQAIPRLSCGLLSASAAARFHQLDVRNVASGHSSAEAGEKLTNEPQISPISNNTPAATAATSMAAFSCYCAHPIVHAMTRLGRQARADHAYRERDNHFCNVLVDRPRPTWATPRDAPASALRRKAGRARFALPTPRLSLERVSFSPRPSIPAAAEPVRTARLRQRQSKPF